MDTVHDSQAFISHHLNMLERPSTPGKDNVPWSQGRWRLLTYIHSKICSFISNEQNKNGKAI